MDCDPFISWTITTRITPQRQKLYKYYLVTQFGAITPATTTFQRDTKHYTYKYNARFIEQHSDLIEDVGILKFKKTMSIPR